MATRTLTYIVGFLLCAPLLAADRYIPVPADHDAVVIAAQRQKQKQKTPYAQRQPAQGTPVDCFNSAKARTYLLDEQIEHLCHCQHTARNVDCFLDAKARTYLLDEEAIRLCTPAHYSDLDCLEH